jgi:hypothetical protein
MALALLPLLLPAFASDELDVAATVAPMVLHEVVADAAGTGTGSSPIDRDEVALALHAGEFELVAAGGASFGTNAEFAFDGIIRYGVLDGFQLMFPLMVALDAMPRSDALDVVFSGGLSGLVIPMSRAPVDIDAAATLAVSIRGRWGAWSFLADAAAEAQSWRGSVRFAIIPAVGASYSPWRWLTVGLGAAVRADLGEVAVQDWGACVDCQPAGPRLTLGSVRVTPMGPLPLVAFHLTDYLDLVVLGSVGAYVDTHRPVEGRVLGGLGLRL